MREYLPRTKQSVIKLIIAVALPLLVGYSASALTLPNIPTWYADLVKPPLTPPNWIFGPVWTTLYVLMGLSCYMIWRLPRTAERQLALYVYGAQLALNGLWSLVFFELQLPLLAFANIVLLWVSIVTTIRLFMPLDRCAAFMHIPTLLWVSFAAYLNFGVFWLN